jgi:hypothetical protein
MVKSKRFMPAKPEARKSVRKICTMALEHGNEGGPTKEEVAQSPSPHISSCFVSSLRSMERVAALGPPCAGYFRCLLSGS